MDIEFERVLLAYFCGYFLTLSGSFSQIVTNNKLASSSTLGFDGLAVVMVLLSQFLLLLFPLHLSIEHLSFIFFLGFFCIVIFLSKRLFLKQGISVNQKMQKIILLGLGFNLLVGGLFSVLQFLFVALNYEFPMGLWFGDFKFYNKSTLIIFFGLYIVSSLYVYKLSKQLKFLALGNDFARGLGIDVNGLVQKSLLVSLLFTGIVVSYFGVFSFIGLIFPHILRNLKIFKYSMQHELLLGPIIAGVILSGIDYLCYLFPIMGAEVPVGMVCSVIGSFVLLYLLSRK